MKRTYIILTKHTSHITPREKHRPAPMVSLDTRLLAPMWRNHVDLGRFGANEARARLLESIHAAPTRTEVAFVQMVIREGAFPGGFYRCEQLIAGDVLVQQVGRGDADVSFGDERSA